MYHCSEPFLKLLYVTPERIVKGQGTRAVLDELYQNEMLARFVIDEAHCVSSWGHDFRKDYAQLQLLKNEFREVPIVALTATARKKVADDTMRILQIEGCCSFNTGMCDSKCTAYSWKEKRLVSHRKMLFVSSLCRIRSTQPVL